jgi:hypothetical protein
MKKLCLLTAVLLSCLSFQAFAQVGHITQVSRGASSTSDYSNGVFLLNEDWFGHSPSSLNYYSYADTTLHYNVYKAENANCTLGNTTEFAQLYGGRIFFCSKQNYGDGGRLIVADATTLKLIKSFETIGGADARAYCGISPEKGYISTSSGIYVFDAGNLAVGNLINGTSGIEVGDMRRVDNRVYAVALGKSLLVIDATADILIKSVNVSNLNTLFVTKTGGIYANVNSSTWGLPGSKATEMFLKIDPETLMFSDTVKVPMAAQNTSFAWKSSIPAVDPDSDVIYYSPAEGSSIICKYSFATGEFTKDFMTLPVIDGVKQNMYGSVVGLDPHNGDIIVEAFNTYSSKDYWLDFFDRSTGKIRKTVKLNQYYWFPAMAFFPDLYAPVINVDDQSLTLAEGQKNIDLLAAVTDADNLSSLAVTTVTSANEHIATVKVEGYKLMITPISVGTTSLTINVNSNGKVETKTVGITVKTGTGVDDNIAQKQIEDVKYYNLSGMESESPFEGVNIVVTRYSDGSTTTSKRIITK